MENKVSILLKLVLIRGKYAHLPVTEFMHQITNNCCLNENFANFLLPTVTEYDDLRYFMCLEAVNFTTPENLVALLASTDRKIEKDNDLKIYTSIELIPNPKSALAYRQAFQKAWLHILSTKLSPKAQKFILSVLHARVIINMNKPQLLMDFLTDVYSRGILTEVFIEVLNFEVSGASSTPSLVPLTSNSDSSSNSSFSSIIVE
ncbi:hypothetical protein FF38_02616, partial [Lucilia cuprina]